MCEQLPEYVSGNLLLCKGVRQRQSEGIQTYVLSADGKQRMKKDKRQVCCDIDVFPSKNIKESQHSIHRLNRFSSLLFTPDFNHSSRIESSNHAMWAASYTNQSGYVVNFLGSASPSEVLAVMPVMSYHLPCPTYLSTHLFFDVSMRCYILNQRPVLAQR